MTVQCDAATKEVIYIFYDITGDTLRLLVAVSWPVASGLGCSALHIASDQIYRGKKSSVPSTFGMTNGAGRSYA